MKKTNKTGAKFIKQTQKIINIVEDEKVVDILNLMIEEFNDLTDVKSEFVNTVNANIEESLSQLENEVKENATIEIISELLREIKNSLVKRYNLVSNIE